MSYATPRVIVKRWICTKTRYQHRRLAVRAAKRIPQPMWVYRCKGCNRYHLTSSPPPDGHGRAF